MPSSPIYKRDSVGNVRTWQYEVDGPQWRTTAGLLDGQKVTSGWTVCVPKSQPTAELQAQFEAAAEEKKKLERDYHRDIDDIDLTLMFKPMLAQKYEGVTFPVYAQPKLDGIRCIATVLGLFSRTGKRIYGVPHIDQFLIPYFESDPNLVLDGELYNHDLKDDFNSITSIVRKQNPTDEQLSKSEELIQYHVYDCPSQEGNFRTRQSRLEEEFGHVSGPVKVVDTVHVGNQDVLDHTYSHWMEVGFEGQMVRLNGAYEQKRSKNLLKRKEFQDEEFPVVAIEEGLGNWAGYAKKIVCRLPDGRTFGAGVAGSQAFTRELLENRDDFIGKPATIKYFALTPDGVPRFPVATNFARIDV